jgi:hypothetical protein
MGAASVRVRRGAAGLRCLTGFGGRVVVVAVYLNGSRVAGNPGSVMLSPPEAIAVTYRRARCSSRPVTPSRPARNG